MKKTKQDVADNQHGSGCLWQPLSGTFPDDSTRKRNVPKIEQREESEQKEPDLEEAKSNLQSRKNRWHRYLKYQCQKTGDSWW